MSDDFSSSYLKYRGSDPELDSDIARTKQADADGLAQEALAKQEPSNPYMQQAAGQQLEAKAMGQMGKDAIIGLYDAARNTAQFMVDVGRNAGQGELNAEAANKGEVAQQLPEVSLDKLAPDFMREADALRNKLAEGSSPADLFTQKALQFAIPFAGAMKIAGAPTVAKGVIADAVTNLAVWEPHEGRFADLLKEILPDNSLVAPVVDYLASDPNDTDAEGRFKNALDGLMATGVMASVVGFVKTGAMTLKYVKDGGLHGPVKGSPQAQVGAINPAAVDGEKIKPTKKKGAK